MVTLKTLLDKASPKLKGLKANVKEKTIQLITLAYGEKIYIGISAGFRSFEEQNKLYEQGRSKGGNIVTNARGGESYHNYGVAIDFFIYSSDLSTVSWKVDKKWRRVVSIAKGLGFEWGGDWKSFPDYPHLQISNGMTINQLKNNASVHDIVVGKIAVTGSFNIPTIKEIQRLLGIKQTGKLDSKTIKRWEKHMKVSLLKRRGKMDTNFIKLLQRWYGTTVDGVISRPSLLVSKIQIQLNKGII